MTPTSSSSSSSSTSISLSRPARRPLSPLPGKIIHHIGEFVPEIFDVQIQPLPHPLFQDMLSAIHTSWNVSFSPILRLNPHSRTEHDVVLFNIRPTTLNFPIIQEWINTNGSPSEQREIDAVDTHLQELDAHFNAVINYRGINRTNTIDQIGQRMLSPVPFMQLEASIYTENDQNLMRIWSDLHEAMIEEGQNVPDLEDVDAIKTWLSDPRNQPALDAIEVLELSRSISTIPQEVISLHLPNLKRLNIANSQIAAIPTAFRRHFPTLTQVFCTRDQFNTFPTNFQRYCIVQKTERELS